MAQFVLSASHDVDTGHVWHIYTGKLVQFPYTVFLGHSMMCVSWALHDMCISELQEEWLGIVGVCPSNYTECAQYG